MPVSDVLPQHEPLALVDPLFSLVVPLNSPLDFLGSLYSHLRLRLKAHSWTMTCYRQPRKFSLVWTRAKRSFGATHCIDWILVLLPIRITCMLTPFLEVTQHGTSRTQDKFMDVPNVTVSGVDGPVLEHD